MKLRNLCLASLVLTPGLCLAAGGSLAIKATNKLQINRPGQTIELSAKDVAPLGSAGLNTIHIKDAEGNEVLCQAVDTDFDSLHKPDVVIFQADFGPGQTKTFTASAGPKQVYTKGQFKAHGRFVRERFDDFAWENDRVAHRMYGKALETWEGEPLTSSTVDIWSKRVAQMVQDEWYMVDNYHADTGQGADFYSAGPSRGCGGNGLWQADKLWVSKNFVDSRVLANGPIRVMFELVYEPFDVAGVQVSEVKRITLDAGSHLDHFQSFYKPQSGGTLVTGIGLKKTAGQVQEFSAEGGWLAVWDRMEKNAGFQGLAVIVDPKCLEKRAEDQRNLLVLAKVPGDNVASYWAGFCWDKAGQFTDLAGWKTYVDAFSQALASPIQLSIDY
jgi:hypothetical protein